MRYSKIYLKSCLWLIVWQVSNKQLRDDLMTLLIAGHETSAAVLTWTFYLLAQVTEFTILVDFLVSLGCSCTAMGPWSILRTLKKSCEFLCIIASGAVFLHLHMCFSSAEPFLQLTEMFMFAEPCCHRQTPKGGEHMYSLICIGGDSLFFLPHWKIELFSGILYLAAQVHVFWSKGICYNLL